MMIVNTNIFFTKNTPTRIIYKILCFFRIFTYTHHVLHLYMLTMDEILNKLKSAGVSQDIIEKLQSGLGDKFESTIISGGLKAAAAKV